MNKLADRNTAPLPITRIHPSSYVHPDAQIGRGVEIGPFVQIEADVTVGDHCWIGSNVVLMNGTRLGKHCRVFPGAVLGAIPQDLKFDGEYSTLQVGHHTTIREYCTLNRGTKAAGTTIVGNHCLLMAYCHVAHDCVVGDRVVLANNTSLGGHVEIGDWVVVGGLCGIHQFVKIGRHAMVAAGIIVRKDVPPFVLTARDPLSYTGVNKIGLTRRGFSREQITQLQDIYRILFVKGYSVSQALELIENSIPPSEEKREVLSFIGAATRGLIKGL